MNEEDENWLEIHKEDWIDILKDIKTLIELDEFHQAWCEAESRMTDLFKEFGIK